MLCGAETLHTAPGGLEVTPTQPSNLCANAGINGILSKVRRLESTIPQLLFDSALSAALFNWGRGMVTTASVERLLSLIIHFQDKSLTSG